MTTAPEPSSTGPVTPGGLWTLSERFLKAYSGTVFKIETHPAQGMREPDVLYLTPESETDDVGSREVVEITPSPSGIWSGAIDSPQLFMARVGTEEEVLETLLNCLQSMSTGS